MPASFRLIALVLAGTPVVALAQDADVAASEAGGYRSSIAPYIEASQVLSAQIDPENDVVTWTNLAVGIDASIVGRNSAASATVRYERRIGWDDDRVDGDTLSGIARAGISVTRGLTLEAGGYASRTRVETDGATSLGGFAGDDSSTSQIYSVYAGPAVHTMAGDVEIEGGYRFGYTKVEQAAAFVASPTAETADIFDEGTSHNLQARAGVRPDVIGPMGLGIGGGYSQQDVSNFDQRVRDGHVRADVMIPVSPTVALVAGIGAEDVEVSSRDIVRDSAGVPVTGPDGRYVVDRSSPRQIDYETDGLIWDVGVMWRPSRRTSLEAYAGRRYGMMNYHGSFSYAPNSHETFGIYAYDTLTSFGGALVNQLAGLPANFDAFSNPLNGQIGGCVTSADDDNCFASALGSLRSAVFRSRGIAGSYSLTMGRSRLSAGIGYDRREYIPNAASADLENVTDDMIWLAVNGVTELDARSTLSAGASMSWFDSELSPFGQSTGYNMSVAYNRELLRGLSGVAAVGLDGVIRESLPDFLAATALVGVRYTFLDR